MNENRTPVSAGLSILGGFVIGTIALLAGLLAVFNEYDYIGAGLCFLASALAFGMLANALFRK